MRERELEILGEELSDVGSSDEIGVINFDNFQDLEVKVNYHLP